jgi:D-alanine-D-alanine ligase
LSSPSRILLLYSVVEAVQQGEPQDLVADLETFDTAQSIVAALQSAGYPITMVPIRSEEDVLSAVDGVDPRTTLVFNLCETLGTISTQVSRVPYRLEQRGFCYVGATPENLDACQDKGYIKTCLLQHGIPTAPYQVFHTGDEPITAPLPALVKPVSEHCSMGINRNAVVCDAASLQKQVAYILKVYKQPAMAEAFLDGREFSVSLWGNGTIHVLGVGEVDFSTCTDRWRVDDFESKWSNRFAAIYPAPLDNDLKAAIHRLALATYRATGCRDYARLDLRQKDGELYVMDVNPNPGLSIGGGFATAARLAGYDYSHMLQQIVQWAWRRSGKKSLRQRMVVNISKHMTEEIQVRITWPEEAPAILAIADGVGVFDREEVATVDELLRKYVSDGPQKSGYYFLSCVQDGRILGFACYGPRALTHGTYDLFWICSARGEQGKGVGSALLRQAEQAVRAAGGYLIIIETSNTPGYEAARRFYEAHAYHREAVIQDFYSVGDGLVLYSKRLE